MIRLKAERLKRGWTQVDLAFHAKVAVAEISRIEKGRVTHPYPGHAQRLAAALGLSSTELLEDVEETAYASHTTDAVR
jgi:transcriptional regulator with XRE-family HTH domain